MNKFIPLLFIITLSGLQIHAQDIKPTSGDWGVELNFAPFSSSPVRINYIRLRNFTESNKAFRLGLFLGADFQNESFDPDVDDKVKDRTIEFGIRPGFENHFEGTDRLSPYIGIEADMAFKYSKSTYENGSNESSVTGAWDRFGTERGFFRFGINGISGMDFYIHKGLYMGVEFGFGMEFVKQADIKIETNGSTDDEDTGGSTFQLGPNVNGNIRLGFNF